MPAYENHMKLSALFSSFTSRGPKASFDPVAPEVSFCVIGDVHGRFDLLTLLVDALPSDKTIICVGDLVDRGDQSADVLRFVQGSRNIVSLMGNHEAMMLDFLGSPEDSGPRWLRHGGVQTLTSFGIHGVTEAADGPELIRARDALYEAMGEDLVDWLSGLEPIGWSGNVAVVHAGANPNIPLENHDAETFVWGHPEFGSKPRSDGFWIVHGHTVVESPRIKDGRISVDTGAYNTGRLTAAVVTPTGVEFLST